MNKKQKLLVLITGLSVMITTSAFSQSDTSHVKKNEIGIAIGGLIFNYGNYGVIYKHNLGKSVFLRAAFSGKASFKTYNSSAKAYDYSAFSPSYSIRLGLEKRKNIFNNKGQFYLGFDLAHSLNDQISFEEDTTIHTKNRSIEIQPVIGIKYFITPKISLGCEFDALVIGYAFQNKDYGSYYPINNVYVSLSPSTYLMLSYNF